MAFAPEAIFSQSKEMARVIGKDPTALGKVSSGGACQLFSIAWAQRHRGHKSEGPAARIAYLKQDNVIFNAVEFQLYYEQYSYAVDAMRKAMPTGANKKWLSGMTAPTRSIVKRLLAEEKQPAAQVTELYGQAGFMFEPTDVWDAPYSATTVANRIREIVVQASRSHTYFQISLRGTGGGHAVAAYKSGGSLLSSAHLYLFDPNYGEYKVKESEIASFIGGLLKKYHESNLKLDKIRVARLT